MAGGMLLAVAIAAAVWSCVVRAGTELPLHTIGFRQGTRQVITCANGRPILGLEITTDTKPNFADPVLASVRLICGSGKVSVDGGAAIDGARKFGPAQLQGALSAECPPKTVVTSLKWRFARQVANCEKRAAGVTIICGNRGNHAMKALRLDTVSESPTSQHSEATECSSSQGVSSVALWYNHWEFNGLEVAGCGPAS